MGHAVRGIGSYTRNLVDVLKSQKGIQLVRDVRSADIVHYPYFDLFYNTLNLVKKPTVVTVYDVIPLLYPQYYQPGIRGKLNFNSQKEKLKKVDAIITISETSKKDIVRLLDAPQEKVFPIHLATGKNFKPITNHQSLITVQKKYKLPSSFVLYVGDINYNKNILGLVKACKIINLPLVICGKQAIDVEETIVTGNIRGPRDWMRYLFNMPHPELMHFEELIKEFNQNSKIIRLGFVPDDELVEVYNLATVYCQPSFYEGFGLPVLEAMACGCPVVVAKTQALVEIAEGAALFVDPKDPKEIAEGLKKVVNSEVLRGGLIKNGLVHAKKFSWNETALATIEIYRKVVRA